ncbi:MAG: YaiO family outer membrane beta-barrel protein [Inquilinus sp.]|nr:YaiO family outer membrane beta-barrel protein [Inquilinus sp.]
MPGWTTVVGLFRRRRSGFAAAMLAAHLASIAAASATAQEDAFAADFRQGMEARAAGTPAVAIDRFEAALMSRPGDAETLFFLGLSYIEADRLAEAEVALSQGVRQAPEYADIHLALARVISYRGAFDEAESIVDQVLASAPGNAEALVLKGRLAFYDGDLGGAALAFDEALAIAPNSFDGWVGRGDVAEAAGDFDRAAEAWRRALIIDPRADGPGARLDALAGRQAAPRWRLDTTLSYSDIGPGDRQPWREAFAQLNRSLDDRTNVRVRVELSERYGLTDTYIEAGVDRRFDWGGVYAAVGGTPNADFREQAAVRAGLALRLGDPGAALENTLALVDGSVARYSTGTVNTVKPGVQHYLLDGRLWITGQAINTINEVGDYQSGWALRADAAITDAATLYAGYADSPETILNQTVRTGSYTAGAVVSLGERLGVRVDLLDERREGYERRSLSLSLSVGF